MLTVRAGVAVGCRRLLLFLTPLFTLLLAAGTAANAHLDVRIVVHHDGRGSVWADVTWSDGHPVGTPLVATMSARTPAGDRVGPVPLRGADPRVPAMIRYEGTLPAGQWTVTVDVALPGVGYCQTVLTVLPPSSAEPGTPRSVTCGATPAAGGRSDQREGDPSAGEEQRGALVAVAGMVLLAAGLSYRRWSAKSRSR